VEAPLWKLSFGDGYALDNEIICLASRTEEDLETDMSRVSVIKRGKWTYADFDDVAVSVTCLQRERVAFFLGYNGTILIIHLPVSGRGSRSVDVIPVSEEFGNLLRIRNIAEHVYVCGMSGQVYRRESRSWKQIDHGLRGEAGLDFEDIGGFAPDDLYAVASSGVVVHFDGQQWSRLDFPTNRPLSGVRCVAEGEVYICGNDGGLFRGRLNKWEFIGDRGVEENFWAVEKFGETVFVAYDEGLFAHDGKSLSKVNFGVGDAFDGHRLHANDGLLWSFGEEHVLCFDGTAWRRIV
jgi:hypothetical protein